MVIIPSGELFGNPPLRFLNVGVNEENIYRVHLKDTFSMAICPNLSIKKLDCSNHPSPIYRQSCNLLKDSFFI